MCWTALVAGSIPGPESSEFVPLLGGFEVALGLGLRRWSIENLSARRVDDGPSYRRCLI